MRLALFLAASAACLATAPAALAQSLWSPLRYQAPDGYVWDGRGGVWRSPRPILDRATGRREYLTRLPSSTACCDKTGLSFPMGSVNEDIGTATPVETKQAERSPRKNLRAALRERLAREADYVDAQIARVQGMDGVSDEVKAAVIRDLQAKRAGGRASDDAETGGGSASSLYGSLAGQSAGQLEGTARNRRHDPSSDMTLGDVMGAVGGGLAAGGAAGGGFRQGYRSGPASVTTQVRRAPTPDYGPAMGDPRRSDISGTGH